MRHKKKFIFTPYYRKINAIILILPKLRIWLYWIPKPGSRIPDPGSNNTEKEEKK
jgi:hypothetical protein